MKLIKKYLLSLILVVAFLTGCSNNTNYRNTETNNNELLEKKGHTLSSIVGYFIIDKDGSVYYQPYKNINYLGATYELTELDLSILGTKNTHNIKTLKNTLQYEVYFF